MVRLLVAIWLSATLAVSASASLLVTIDEPYREAELGEYLLYTGTISYTGDAPINIGVGFYAPDGFTADWQGRLGIGEMAPNSTYTGNLFSFRIDDRTNYGLHESRIDFVGYNPANSDMYMDTHTIQVNVVPEPATFLALAPALGLLLRRRARRP
jgi:hypothetical protein